MVAAAPPAVAVIAFTVILKGDAPFSLVATVGGYLGALLLMPLITFGLLGSGYADHGKLVGSWSVDPGPIGHFTGIALGPAFRKARSPIEGRPPTGGFLMFTYTIVGLNRSVLTHP